MAYNWEQKDWPSFTYNLSAVEDKLYKIADKIGTISGVLQALPEDTQLTTLIDTMVVEAIKTSEIEGEFLSRNDVMSSIKNNLGLNENAEKVSDKRASGIGELMAAIRNSFATALDEAILFSWHEMLLGFDKNIKAGQWRTSPEPMQVVSGTYGREKIHFEAPLSANVPDEMSRFIKWFNESNLIGSKPIVQAPVRSAIAHLYFETIHPFEDGNGRIGRAISEKALSQGVGRPVLLSLSRAILKNREQYYEALKTAQRSNEITPWINYFVDLVLLAQTDTEHEIDFILRKTKFFDRHKGHLSERQLKVVRRMLEEGPDGFKGGMNARKYMAITQVSKATATRDLQQLQEMQILNAGIEGGRSTGYSLNI